MNIGTYEYSRHTKKLHYTEGIPKIFRFDAEEEEVAEKLDAFADFLQEMKKNPVPNEKAIYRQGERYIHLEEIETEGDVFGVAVDVTAEITKRLAVEKERDIDTLTGLYNRRGLESRIKKVFAEPQTVGFGALCMIDGDGLKNINDTYGHEKGDIYIKKIGETLASVSTEHGIAGRVGGDEFVLFLYGYGTQKELAQALRIVKNAQSATVVDMGDGIQVPVLFSMGYEPIHAGSEYHAALKEADAKMYGNKKERRKSRRAAEEE